MTGESQKQLLPMVGGGGLGPTEGPSATRGLEIMPGTHQAREPSPSAVGGTWETQGGALSGSGGGRQGREPSTRKGVAMA